VSGQIAVRATREARGLAFGIEHFYVPEGMGMPRFEKIEVEAAVSTTDDRPARDQAFAARREGIPVSRKCVELPMDVFA
jgi:hypothetical protein